MKRPSTPVLVLVTVAGLLGAAVTTAYLVEVYRAGSAFAFPLDDAYIYLTYAKQIARGRPFSYFDGSGFTAGATSMLWPVVLAPFWGLGLRGEAFPPAAFAVCALLLGGTLALAAEIGRRTLGWVGGVCAALLIAASGPLTWGYLAGMEVALAGTLILSSAVSLYGQTDDARPPPHRLALLAATAIARPEAGLLIALVVLLLAAGRLYRRDARGALRWCVVLVAPAALALVTRVWAGHFAPNTAVAKSHFYLPGFDWTYYVDTLRTQTRACGRGLFWNSGSPLGWPRVLVVLWLFGAVRLLHHGARTRRLGSAALLVLAPVALLAAVLATSGQWQFQNYRYVSAALPPLYVVAGVGLAPPAGWVRGLAPVAIGLAAAVAVAALPRLRLDTQLYAESARDMRSQVLTIGRWVAKNLPANARLGIHDVGAAGYFGERPMYDVIGLITNDQADDCNHGPGARFEVFERMRPEARPTHFVYYAGWLINGARDLYGASLFAAHVPARWAPAGTRLVGGGKMEVFEARWDLLGSGEAPLEPHPGWEVADVVDVADLESERRHAYRADLGRRRFGDPTGRWSDYFSSGAVGAGGSARTVADGGRTIRAGGESFTVTADPTRALRLVVRVGGPAVLHGSRIPNAPVTLVVTGANGRALGWTELPPPGLGFSEVILAELPANSGRPRTLRFSIQPKGGDTYRPFHYFVFVSR